MAVLAAIARDELAEPIKAPFEMDEGKVMALLRVNDLPFNSNKPLECVKALLTVRLQLY